uniref:Uncharacterized protein n=1 Tax=Oryza nivara TaxID=4536 RepID=A0A0E0FWF3_ORYNI
MSRSLARSLLLAVLCAVLWSGLWLRARRTSGARLMAASSRHRALPGFRRSLWRHGKTASSSRDMNDDTSHGRWSWQLPSKRTKTEGFFFRNENSEL